MRREPQRPYWVASSMIAAVSRSSSSATLRTRRWLERGWPMTSPMTWTTPAARRRRDLRGPAQWPAGDARS
jgi:hypothetical protein